MGIQETFKTMAKTIFTALGNVASAATYTSVGIKRYNTTTGGTTSTDIAYSVEMIFDNFSSYNVDGRTILATDKKALIPVDNLTPSPVIRRDTISISGVTWEIIGELGDPAEAMHIFHIRRAGT